MGVRWLKTRFKVDGDFAQFAVEDWRNVQAAGTTIGTPAKEAVFGTNWTPFTAAAPMCQYMKDPFGWVHFRGGVEKLTGGAAGATETLLTLPVGYRPANASTTNTLFFLVAGSAAALVKVRVNTLGIVAALNTTADIVRTDLSGITFRAETESV